MIQDRTPRILALDDDLTWLSQIPIIFEDHGYIIDAYSNIDQGLMTIESNFYDVVLLDMNFEGDTRTGLDIFRRISAKDSEVDVIVISGETEARKLIDVMNAGITQFIPKPANAEQIRNAVDQVLKKRELRRRSIILNQSKESLIIGSSKSIIELKSEIIKAAQSGVRDILVTGESGTGKEVVARAIADLADPSKRFIPVHCAAINDGIAESELFGHVKGAFTSADRDRIGAFEAAQGGFVFLDEIGDMPLTMQSHLLRVLNDRTFYRIGGTQEVQADVRFIAATNKNLQQAIRQGTFREDLYFRLAVIPLTLPPLRERLEDVPSLVHHFLTRRDGIGANTRRTLSPAALEALTRYTWPGNVRELENVLTRALILCPEETIEPEHLSLPAPCPTPTPIGAQDPPAELMMFSYHKSMEAYSHKLIEAALQRSGWNQTKAAELLGLQRTYLTRILREKQITRKPGTSDPPQENQGA